MVELNQNPTNSDEDIEYEYVELEPGQELPEGYEYEYVDELGNKISDPSELDVLNMPMQNNMADDEYSTSPNGIENAIHSAQNNVDFPIENSDNMESETSQDAPFPSFLQAPKEEQSWLDGEPLSSEDVVEEDMPQFLNENDNGFSFKNENSADTDVVDVQISADELELNTQTLDKDDAENLDILAQLNPSSEVDVNMLPDVDTLPNNNEKGWAVSDLDLDSDISFDDLLNDTADEQNVVSEENTMETLTTEVEDNGNTYPVEEEIIAPQEDYVENDTLLSEENFSDINENSENETPFEQETIKESVLENDFQNISDDATEKADEFDLENMLSQESDIQDYVLPETENEEVEAINEGEPESTINIEPEYLSVPEIEKTDGETIQEPEYEEARTDTEYETVSEENITSFENDAFSQQNVENEVYVDEITDTLSENIAEENHNIDEKDISPQVVYPEVENLDAEKYNDLLSVSRLINKNMGIQNFSAFNNINSIIIDDIDFDKDELASWNLVLFAQEVAPLSERVNVIGKANPQMNYFASLIQNGAKQVEFFNEEDLKILNTSKTCVAVKGNFICGDFAENGSVFFSNFMTIPLQNYAGKIIRAQTPLSGLLTGPNGSLLFFANVSQIVIPNSEIKEIDADKLQYKISKWYSGTLRDKYFEFDAHSQSGEFEGNDDMNAIHVNVNTSSYGWNVAFDNGITMNLRDLREYQTRFGKMPSRNGVLSYGQRTLTFKNVERIVVYEEAQYYFYS